MSLTDQMNKLSEFDQKIDQQSDARKRLNSLFDADSFVELDKFVMTNEEAAGVVAGYGLVEGSVVYAYAQDVTANSGAVSAEHAKKIKKIYDLAAKTGCPVVSIFDSKGAKLSEGHQMLSEYSNILKSANNLSGVVPQVAVVLGTCAGVSAVMAASHDFVLMSKDAELFMTAPFIAKANGDDTTGAGSAENAAASGVASAVFETEEETIAQTRKLITMLPQNNLSALPIFDFAENAAEIDTEGCPKDIVKAIADVDSAIELNAEYGKGIYTFFATVAGVSTAFLITSSKNELDKDSCEKAKRFVKIADAFSIPVVTLVNTKGFSLTSDVSIVKAASELSSAYAEATTAKVSIICGKAYGPALITLASKNANSDVTLAWPNASISALCPDTAVEFLWEDKLDTTLDAKAAHAKLVKEYEETEASPFEAAKGGYIEAVIAPNDTRKVLINMLDMLAGKRESKLPKKHATV